MQDKETITEEIEEQDEWYRGPLKIILSLFLLLLIISWVFSYYGGKIDPRPERIPTVDEVFFYENGNISHDNTITTRNDYKRLVNSRDPQIKQTADRIATISCKESRVCYAKAMFYFVRDNFQYVNDPYEREYIKSPKETLSSGTLDCEDGAILTASLIESVGIKTRFVFIPKHAYIEIWLPEASSRYKQEDDWIPLDVTCNNCEFGEIPIQNKKSYKTYI